MSFAYDQNSNLIRQTDVTKKTAEYQHDLAGWISRAWNDGKQVAANFIFVEKYLLKMWEGPSSHLLYG